MNLQQLRKSKNLTCKQVAEGMGIHTSYYSHLENGRRRFTRDLIIKLAKVLDEPEEIISDKVRNMDVLGLTEQNWIANIKIHGQNVLKAFETELILNRPDNLKDEFDMQFAMFIQNNIAHSIMAEFGNNPDFRDELKERYRHLM